MPQCDPIRQTRLPPLPRGRSAARAARARVPAEPSEKVNILEDELLETKYRYAIPVIVLNGHLELQAPIFENELRAALLLH